MIISRTPLRVSFVGGGSDLAVFYQKSPGAVVSTTINKYIYIFVNKKFDRRIRASYSVTEIVDHVNQLQHELIREALKLMKINGGIEITSISDIPSEGTGLGSSSSYLVGLLNALHAYKGESVSAEILARQASHIEINILGKPIGCQDQYAAAYGGINYFRFNQNGSVYVEPIMLRHTVRQKIEAQLMMFYTGKARPSATVLSNQKQKLVSSKSTFASMQQMVNLATQLRDELHHNSIKSLGMLLHQNWLLKKKLSRMISTPQIDRWYEKARQNGAIGGKILGAGSGGFLLFLVPPAKQHRIKQVLPKLTELPFHFEPYGSRIIYEEA